MEYIKEDRHETQHLILNLLILVFVCDYVVNEGQGIICLLNRSVYFCIIFFPAFMHIFGRCGLLLHSGYMSLIVVCKTKIRQSNCFSWILLRVVFVEIYLRIGTDS